MRTVLQALRELLEPRVIQNGPLELSEDDPSSRCPTTKISKSGLAVALRFRDWEYNSGIKIPTNRWLFPLLDWTRSTPPACRSCDYIIFHVTEGPSGQDELFVLLCELKSGRGKGGVAQLRNGKLIADYLLAVMRLHGKVQEWPQEIKFRGIVFAEDSPSVKAATRSFEQAIYIPDGMCKGLQVMTLRPGPSYPLQYFCV